MEVQEILKAAKSGNLVLDGIPEKTYFSIPAMSSSGLKEFRKGPGYFRYSQLNPDNEDTPDRKFFRAVHMAISEPDRFAASVIGVDGHRGRTDVKEKIAAYEKAGLVVIKDDEFESAKAISDYCRKHPLLSKVLKSGFGERTLVWTDPTTGVLCKARIDWSTPNGVLVDWKNYDVIWSDDEIERQIRRMRYPFQTAWYLEGYLRCFGKPAKAFYHGFLRTDAPIDVAVIEIAQQSLEETVPIIRNALEVYAECLAKDHWPMSPTEVRTIVTRPFFD